MENIVVNLSKIGWTVGILSTFFLIGKLLNRGVEKFGIKNNFSSDRIVRAKRLIDSFLAICFFTLMTLIWGFHLKEFFVVAATIFTILGTALFASWSNLSNISSGLILFFSYRLKVGDRVLINIGDHKLEGTIKEMRLFYLEVENDNGDIVMYPNNLMIHQIVVVMKK
ncbi:mechanosensitive ion channel family protein [uncultured Ilyobacter sp.]|uniref:mechanosensitive ion channel family protein n=1 Tax=uncultured Ilyobacter sp. TaxID=544433 RepID=UPI0029C001A1|nr:mechanosensitive ion channel family protein [uncultured Ilyobacter sp.]